MFDAIATVLAWFYSLIPNYAAAIALLTLTVMVLLTPLTLKGTKSMLQLQRLQPEMKKIQQQHKGDRQKLNEEMMKFYQENKINPIGGCLPMLLQMPVLFVMYRVIRHLTKKGADGTFDPSYISHNTKLFKALDGSKEMVSFGVDLSKSAVEKLGENFVQGIPYLVMILFVAGTSFYQQRQISARNKNGTPLNPQQAMLMKIMPAFFALISLTLPAGIVVYFLVSNLYRIGQQAMITRTIYKEHEAIQSTKPVDVSDEAPPAKPTPNRPKPSTREPRNGAAGSKAASGDAQPVVRPPKGRTDGGRTTPARPRPAPTARPKPTPGRPPSGRVTPPGGQQGKKQK